MLGDIGANLDDIAEHVTVYQLTNFKGFGVVSEILEPLDMSTTTLTDQSPAAANPATPVSKNYTVGEGGPEEVGQLDLGSFAPIGGMTTTAADMGRWLRFHLNQGELEGGIYDFALAENFGPLDIQASHYRDMAASYLRYG